MFKVFNFLDHIKFAKFFSMLVLYLIFLTYYMVSYSTMSVHYLMFWCIGLFLLISCNTILNCYIVILHCIIIL